MLLFPGPRCSRSKLKVFRKFERGYRRGDLLIAPTVDLCASTSSTSHERTNRRTFPSPVIFGIGTTGILVLLATYFAIRAGDAASV